MYHHAKGELATFQAHLPVNCGHGTTGQNIHWSSAPLQRQEQTERQQRMMMHKQQMMKKQQMMQHNM